MPLQCAATRSKVLHVQYVVFFKPCLWPVLTRFLRTNGTILMIFLLSSVSPSTLVSTSTADWQVGLRTPGYQRVLDLRIPISLPLHKGVSLGTKVAQAHTPGRTTRFSTVVYLRMLLSRHRKFKQIQGIDCTTLIHLAISISPHTRDSPTTCKVLCVHKQGRDRHPRRPAHHSNSWGQFWRSNPRAPSYLKKSKNYQHLPKNT